MTAINTVDIVVQDMTMSHEAVPKGVSASWQAMTGPKVLLGNTPRQGDRFLIPWGMLYESEVGNASPNTRVELKNLDLYVLSRSTGKWKKLSASVSPKGEDRKGGVAASSTDIRVEPSGTISVRTGKNGYHFDFWSGQGRVEIDPADIAGVFSTFQARLILHDPTKPDDRGTAQYIAAAGADYGSSASDQEAIAKGNDLGTGRFKYVVNDWRAFNMVTLSEDQIRQNPPPLTDLSIPAPPAVTDGTGSSDAPALGSGSAGVTNSIDIVIDDMRLLNDAPLAGAPVGPGWATGPGTVIMGNRARGSATPSWWQPNDRSFKSDAPWNVLLPWMVIFDGVQNTASNTRVEMRNLKAYYLSRSSGTWKLLADGPIDGNNYPKTLIGSDTTRADLRIEQDGTVSVKPAGGNAAFHGWCCGAQPIPVDDIAAVFITMQARLSIDNPALPDDRANAQYLVQVGGDYYPTAQTSVEAFAPTGYNPGIGLSRFKKMGPQWQSISFSTIDSVPQDPVGGVISEAEFRSNPPPLD